MSEQNRELQVVIRDLEQRVEKLEQKWVKRADPTIDSYIMGRWHEAYDQLENIRIMANAAEGMAGETSDDTAG